MEHSNDSLREVLTGIVNQLSGYRHVDLPEVCIRFGLPEPPDGSPSEGPSKAERIADSWSRVGDDQLSSIAHRFLASDELSLDDRVRLEDLIWANEHHPAFTKKTRRDIAIALDPLPLWKDPEGFITALSRLGLVGDPRVNSVDRFLGLSDAQSMRMQVEQHVIRNDDWNVSQLFQRLDVWDISDRRFALLLETLISDTVLPDAQAQRDFAIAINPILRPVGVWLDEVGTHEGYPLFQLIDLGAVRGKPKNIIFASIQGKPDLRFYDALDNDVEIVGNGDGVLVYDRPIDVTMGITWDDLQSWWMDTHNGKDPDLAKKELWTRLLACLPMDSPPQRLFFEAYHKMFAKSIHHMPALIPEVWLLWDPKTVKQRGKDALLRFRMDFVMLAPHGKRIVFEVDGKQHYSTDSRPDPAAYARLMSSDRELQLSGYQVFRFGAMELETRTDAEQVVDRFFRNLFDILGVSTV